MRSRHFSNFNKSSLPLYMNKTMTITLSTFIMLTATIPDINIKWHVILKSITLDNSLPQTLKIRNPHHLSYRFKIDWFCEFEPIQMQKDLSVSFPWIKSTFSKVATFLAWSNTKSLSRFKQTLLMAKWFKVRDRNHLIWPQRLEIKV